MLLDVRDFNVQECTKQLKKLEPPASIKAKRYARKRYYMDIVCAFDIETTYIPEIGQSVMYIWQFQLGEEITIIGRTWEAYRDFCDDLRCAIPLSYFLVVYVHNLAYEFQFLAGIFTFQPRNVFLVKNRRPLTAVHGCMEYRCSYLHSNMSLSKFLEAMYVENQKLTYDYYKKRYWYTPLTDEEIAYCVNDVKGLVQAINVEMHRDGDTLYTIPLTSTGYVRRDVKNAMEPWLLTNDLPDMDEHIYTLLRRAFRGGNTHANRYYVGAILENVGSFDRVSSYPDTQSNHEYPMTSFKKLENVSRETLIGYMNHGRALLISMRMTNVRLQDETWGFPYIPKDKTENLTDAVIDNGRVLSAGSLDMVVTDVDYRIIDSEYLADYEFLEVWYSSYNKLPEPMISVVQSYYRGKTELKGIPEKAYEYMKSKNKLNAVYGMTAQDPVRDLFTFDGFEYNTEQANIEKELYKYSQKAFIAYAWGVWCTAWARYELEAGIRIAHETPYAEPVYTDTDSVKYIGKIDLADYNAEARRRSTESGAYAVDKKGITHYMGEYENDGFYRTFRTWGAKKYAYTEQARKAPRALAAVYHDGYKCLTKYGYVTCHPSHITVAGVPKRKGAVELTKAGGLDAFTPGMIFQAGKLETVYNDAPEIKSIQRDGHTISITRNVALRPTTYELSLSTEYEAILSDYDNFLKAMKILGIDINTDL